MSTRYHPLVTVVVAALAIAALAAVASAFSGCRSSSAESSPDFDQMERDDWAAYCTRLSPDADVYRRLTGYASDGTDIIEAKGCVRTDKKLGIDLYSFGRGGVWENCLPYRFEAGENECDNYTGSGICYDMAPISCPEIDRGMWNDAHGNIVDVHGKILIPADLQYSQL